MSRTIELTLTGRLMSADEALRIGLIHHLVDKDEVLKKALEIARELGEKPPVAMRLNKQNFREMTQTSFEHAIEAGLRSRYESYFSGEPARNDGNIFSKAPRLKTCQYSIVALFLNLFVSLPGYEEYNRKNLNEELRFWCILKNDIGRLIRLIVCNLGNIIIHLF